MKLACLQLNPQIGKRDENIATADRLLQDVKAGDLDLLVLPELAFTGYNFPDLPSIEPYLEQTTDGPSTHWALAVASRLQCHVTVGYPEITTTSPPIRYNSLVTVSPTGAVVATYRKSFLYYTDETWASEGDTGFYHGQLGTLGKACMGICMDINPYKFQTPWTKYEFATHCVDKQTPLVVLSMAWLTQLEPQQLKVNAESPDLETLSYWIQRFMPLLEAEKEGEVVVVLANRWGWEKGTLLGTARGVDEEGESVVSYAGSSCVLSVRDGEVKLFDIAGKAEDRLLTVNTQEPPRFALVKRSRDKVATNEEEVGAETPPPQDDS